MTSQAHAAVVARMEELERKLAAQAITQGRRSKSDIECHNCKGKGHIKANCFRKGGGKEGQFPDWWKGPKNINLPSSTPSANLAVGDPDSVQRYAMASVARHGIPAGRSLDSDLYADSAATDHFLRSRDDFITYNQVPIGKQESVKALKKHQAFSGRSRFLPKSTDNCRKPLYKKYR
ncbi:hypothetical protein MPER_03854 [Moniliophthora perniciosa FA553]|nr:hypothetical protein MPER_03854 [Moniliophthora perniciosa FA553]